eukprot:CAMPEP_0168380634 /NCGR_PEP_ID=MMETSP0228-20121227/12463_1 /TAXON_ID=133427 /ORGANISM="Protoceratium reticulatum, Strain CCCM 535 (=CCMP 1889)" /LENGTH=102 /DNA_ID=CAMNT_0008393709 /DNA_START=31 /DNA_END=339 /DNA_ORIENTATION=+
MFKRAGALRSALHFGQDLQPFGPAPLVLVPHLVLRGLPLVLLLLLLAHVPHVGRERDDLVPYLVDAVDARIQRDLRLALVLLDAPYAVVQLLGHLLRVVGQL